MTAWDLHASLASDLAVGGFARLTADATAQLLGAEALADWPAFTASWDDLEVDTHMADGRRDRRRRHACFTVDGGAIAREPHQPHFQRRHHNPLNGGVDRWFAPVTPAVGAHPALGRILTLLGGALAVAAGVSAADARWFVEMHQFRIEAARDGEGRPTPEGVHRDGVDWVAIVMIGRHNITGGVTSVVDPDGRACVEFALDAPLEAVVLDDRRVRHGVTPIRRNDPETPAHRDVLVLTYRDRRRL